LVVSAYFATYSTAATGSKTHRDLVMADHLLRDYAETAKEAVRNQCPTSSTFTTTTTSIPGFSVATTSTLSPANACPSTSTPPFLNQLTFKVTTPGNVTKQLTVDVRTP
jgi:hypothetical protein